MYIAFYSTSDVFAGEEKLKGQSIDCKIVPTPVTDKAYCGVCIFCTDKEAIAALEGMEYRIVEGED
jgi:hypothetical protein